MENCSLGVFSSAQQASSSKHTFILHVFVYSGMSAAERLHLLKSLVNKRGLSDPDDPRLKMMTLIVKYKMFFQELVPFSLWWRLEVDYHIKAKQYKTHIMIYIVTFVIYLN